MATGNRDQLELAQKKERIDYKRKGVSHRLKSRKVCR